MQVFIHPLETESDCITSFAKSELVQYLAKVKDTDNAPEVIALTIVNVPATGEASPPVHDGYCLSWSQNRLDLQATKPKGLLNGVYDLFRLLGFAFPFPGLDR